jgi:hypothetical protein
VSAPGWRVLGGRRALGGRGKGRGAGGAQRARGCALAAGEGGVGGAGCCSGHQGRGYARWLVVLGSGPCRLREGAAASAPAPGRLQARRWRRAALTAAPPARPPLCAQGRPGLARDPAGPGRRPQVRRHQGAVRLHGGRGEAGVWGIPAPGACSSLSLAARGCCTRLSAAAGAPRTCPLMMGRQGRGASAAAAATSAGGHPPLSSGGVCDHAQQGAQQAVHRHVQALTGAGRAQPARQVSMVLASEGWVRLGCSDEQGVGG